jgi:hypothetical protein
MKCIQWTPLGLLAAALMATGCSEPGQVKPPGGEPPAAAPGGGEDHAHAHGHGPNGGVVLDLGSHHAEFTVDHGKQQATILILGDDEKAPTAVAAEELTLVINETKTKDGTVVEAMTVTLVPEDAVDGKASKFVGTDAGIGNVADFDGTVTGEIDGKPTQGEFQE